MTRVQARWTGLAVAEIAVLAALDLVSGGASNYTSAMAVGPLTAAAAAASPSTTAGVGALAITAGTALVVHDGPRGSEAAVRIIVLLVSSVLALAITNQRRRRDVRLADATRLAAAAQRVLLRPVPERLGSYQLAARFRAAVFASTNLTEVVRTLDAVVSPDLGPECFVTLAAAWLAPDGSLETANLGHPDPLIVDADGITALEPATRTTPLGLDPEVRTKLSVLRPGATLLGYTDGLSEARDQADRFFPVSEALRDCGHMPAGPCLDHLIGAATRHAGGALTDDVALLAIQFEPA